jgi:hypothetical protein
LSSITTQAPASSIAMRSGYLPSGVRLPGDNRQWLAGEEQVGIGLDPVLKDPFQIGEWSRLKQHELPGLAHTVDRHWSWSSIRFTLIGFVVTLHILAGTRPGGKDPVRGSVPAEPAYGPAKEHVTEAMLAPVRRES